MLVMYLRSFGNEEKSGSPREKLSGFYFLCGFKYVQASVFRADQSAA